MPELDKKKFLVEDELGKIFTVNEKGEFVETDLIKPLTTQDFEDYNVESLSSIIGDGENIFKMSKIGELTNEGETETKQLLSFKVENYKDIEMIDVKESEEI